MNKIFHDEKLGNYFYDGAWVLEKQFIYKHYKLSIIFQAFEDEEISDRQKNQYDYFIKNYESIFNKSLLLLKERFGESYDKIVLIESIFFNRYDEFGFLGESILDEENGIAIKLSNNNDNIEIGEQNILI